jgi:hypothetical protein
LSIKFAVKVGLCLALAGLFSTLSAQTTSAQPTPPANQDSTGQTQSQSQTSDQGQSAPQTPPAAQTPPASSSQTPSGQAPSGPGANPTSAPTSAQPGQDANKNSQNGQDKTAGKVAGTSNDRLFYALPNFLTLENADKVPPLTVKQKFKVVALGTFDPVNFPWWGTIAAIGQAENSEPAWGQGWVAYAKRYGATAGDSIIENFMVGAVFPSILRQDPRFYYSANGGVFKRTTYAISRVFIIRGDSGKKQFNFSEIFGAALAAGISTNTYHPKGTYVVSETNPHEHIPSDRTLTNSVSVWGTQVGLDTITFVIKEFWPDLHRRMDRKRMLRESASSPSNSTSNPNP